MRPIFTVLAFVLALSFFPAAARVGETLDQCKKRYGKATAIAQVYDFGDEAKDLVYFDFEKNGIQIQIGFLDGKAADLSFHHHHAVPPTADSAGTGNGASAANSTNGSSATTPADVWTQVEIDTLLSANSGGMAWKTVTDGKLTFFPDCPATTASRYGTYQQRDDGVMSTVDGLTLHIFTPDWMTYINAKMLAHDEKVKADQKKNLDGF